MVLVVAMVAVALVLGVSFLAASSTTLGISENLADHSRAQMVADSGLDAALRYIERHDDWDHSIGEPWIDAHAYANGTFTIHVEHVDEAEPSYHRLTVIDHYGENTHEIVHELVTQEEASTSYAVAISRSLSVSTSRIDSFNSADGSYGGENQWDEAIVAGNLNLPSVPDWPDNVGSKQGDYDLDSGSDTFTQNKYFGDFLVEDGAVLYIDGDITIRVDDDFEMDDGGRIELVGDSTLRIYAGGDIELEEGSKINADTGEPWRVVIYHMSNENFEINDGAHVHAIIDAVRSTVELQDDARVFGTIMARHVQHEGSSQIHHDHNPLILDANPRLPVYDE